VHSLSLVREWWVRRPEKKGLLAEERISREEKPVRARDRQETPEPVEAESHPSANPEEKKPEGLMGALGKARNRIRNRTEK